MDTLEITSQTLVGNAQLRVSFRRRTTDAPVISLEISLDELDERTAANLIAAHDAWNTAVLGIASGRYDEMTSAPEELDAKIIAAEKARKQQADLDAAVDAKRAEAQALDEQLAAKRAEAEAAVRLQAELDATVIAKQAETLALDEQLAAQRAEAAPQPPDGEAATAADANIQP